MEWYHKVFLFLKIIFIILFILTKFHIFYTEPEIEYIIEDIIKLMVCIFCLYLFWPFRSNYQIKKHDRYFGFSAGVFLIISMKIFKKNNYIYNLLNILQNTSK
jgi:hypothetical protein